jgi:hypothetical protein
MDERISPSIKQSVEVEQEPNPLVINTESDSVPVEITADSTAYDQKISQIEQEDAKMTVQVVGDTATLQQ